ncbi:hypothetical protein [Chitinolyticbacter meiyuanensis]|uniref:hypothetical protein n=1 Tax=Chitinolyticbacter meiyuanensis TaxID=682798 RepID=UPI0011E5C206|nr:hypothetical protein [Chitinolyticbacter meiyuanensis]
MKNDIADAITAFIARHHHADLLEAMVDTSNGVPYLNLWAWHIQQGKQFGDAMQNVAESGDWGYLADIVDEAGSSTFSIALDSVYPDWPDALDHGDNSLIDVLHAAARALPERTVCMFHHIDAWPPVDVRSGQEMDFS